MNWTVHVAHEAAKQLKAIPPDRRKRILNDIRMLEEDPFRGLVMPLKGKEF
jgi:mRNA-degrading endonuclease RelE of RelBE toxin-antitoxin system